MIIALFMPNTQQIMRDYEPAFDTYLGKIEIRSPAWPRFRLSTGWAVTAGLAFVIAVGSLTRVSEFLYFQF
jgi:hypothetical protein